MFKFTCSINLNKINQILKFKLVSGPDLCFGYIAHVYYVLVILKDPHGMIINIS